MTFRIQSCPAILYVMYEQCFSMHPFLRYDERGFVTRRGEQWYAYNSLGQMESAWEKGRFSVRFFYDDRGRLVAKRDHKKNTVQFVYANPLSSSTVTHVNYPVADRTIR